MGLRRRPWTIGLPLTTGLLTLTLIGGHPSAQAPPLSSGPIAREATLYEAAPKLFAGPKGETLRLWYRSPSPGTGGTIPATASAAGWLPLVEIMPQAQAV